MKADEDFATKLRKQLAPFPHWYLAVLGVDPEFQGRGYAGHLLRPMLARLDRERLPAYLETTTEDYVAMYRHFGFEVIKEDTLPGSDTKMWVMIRKNK
jgi:ribosomal protein S18 acetylase RimI-like enzyme